MKKTFEKSLQELINSYCQENNSNTPDFILAKYLITCLSAFDNATRNREKWYGREIEHKLEKMEI